MEGGVNLLVESKEKVGRVAAIDIMKGICSLLVIIIHFRPFDLHSIGDRFLVGYIANIAVPFFFMCAGYFCFKKSSGGGG